MHPFQVDQGDHLALSHRQRSHRCPHAAYRFLQLGMAVRPRQGRGQFGKHFIIEVVAFCTQVIYPAAIEDGEQPAHQALFFAQLLDPGQTVRQGLLREVVGKNRVVAPRKSHAVESSAAGLDLVCKRSLRPRLQQPHRVSLQCRYDALCGGFIPSAVTIRPDCIVVSLRQGIYQALQASSN
ncbi:MAG: hypothetical protein M5R42_06050 [Rhodocyclaceae bacterium]|nr:hypothetical protein [Rhodocyclaceae bacterium]